MMLKRIGKIMFCMSMGVMWWVTCALEGNAITIAQAVAVLAVAMPATLVSLDKSGWAEWEVSEDEQDIAH